MFRTELKNYGNGIHCYHHLLKFHNGNRDCEDNEFMRQVGERRQTFYEHYHEDIELLAVETGTLYVTLDGKEYTVGEGDILIVNCYENHIGFTEIAKPQLSYHVVLMDPRFLIPPIQCSLSERLMELLGKKFKLRTFIPHGDPLNTQIFELLRNILPRTHSVPKSAECDCAMLGGVYLLLEKLLASPVAAGAGGQPRNLAFSETVSAYIEKNYAAPISTNDICTALGYNLTHFCHLFKKNFADSFTSYLCRYRINKAASGYKNSEKSVTEIAEAVGFSDYCHFSRCFKKYIGVPPSRFFR